MFAPTVWGGDWINLWPGEAPGAKRPPAGTETGGSNWRFSHTEVPQYSLFPAEEPSGTGVVILPGGGYANLAADHEGRQVGEWFAKRGVTAMVVKYRVSANPALGYHYPVPQMDARRAIRTMRSMSEKWAVDVGQIGVMGFSAGGHLCSTAVTMFDDTFKQETRDPIDLVSCRPDFGILVYPAYLVDRTTRDSLFPEVVIRKDTPPCFFVHTGDDHVPAEGSALAYLALEKAGVVGNELHLFPFGGHGYGMRK